MAESANATATHADAELILKLYDLRREPSLRRARHFLLVEFWPKSAEELLALVQEFGSERNIYLRQGVSYWDLAASLVNRGALNADLFLDTAGEALFIYTKLKPYLPTVHAKGIRFGTQLAQLVESNERAKTMQTNMEAIVAARRAAVAHKS